MSLLGLFGQVMGWIGAAERVERLVRRVLPEPEPESQPLGKLDQAHIERQIRSAARPYPPPTPVPPCAPPPTLDRAPCLKPPVGWRCTRGAGHPGPCAAVLAPVTRAVPPPRKR